ncbi:hypothetical protein NX059_004472 [Plenodomus lindquistii]|nr:hypothetical protein NX059_004472 [Plenodomus lindquistii]
MSSSNNTNYGAGGRTRGYSMLAGLPGRSSGSSAQQRRSALTEAFAKERESGPEPEPRTSGTAASSSEDEPVDEDPLPRSKPINIPSSAQMPNASRFAYATDNKDFRNWTTGLPPKKSFLRGDADTPARFKMPRRSTLADMLELDDLLKAAMIDYDGQKYFPLNAATVHHLSPFWRGVKPVSNVGIFKSMIISKEVNNVHADHVVYALERIGEHVDRLVILAPVRTSELGNVFKREGDNIYPSNDWDYLLEFFPKLKHLLFIHPHDIPFDLSTDTLDSLLAAVAHRQAALALQEVSIRVPPGVISATAYNG